MLNIRKLRFEFCFQIQKNFKCSTPGEKGKKAESLNNSFEFKICFIFIRKTRILNLSPYGPCKIKKQSPTILPNDE